MQRKRRPWPMVIEKLVDAFVAAAQANGVHGRVAVFVDESGGERAYWIGVRVPASETVMTRAPRG